MALGSTQPLTEMSTRSISRGKRRPVRTADNLPPFCAVVTKCGNLNFLEPSGPAQASNGTDLPLLCYKISGVQLPYSGPGSSVGIATGYGLDGPEIESRWGAIFTEPVQTGPGTHPASCTKGTGSFPGVKSGRSVRLTPHPF